VLPLEMTNAGLGDAADCRDSDGKGRKQIDLTATTQGLVCWN